MEDFNSYKNSTCFIDKSGTQALFYFPYDEKFKPFDFFQKNEIKLVFADASLEQYTFQGYYDCPQQSLFAGKIVSESILSKTSGEQGVNFVLSQTNGTITLKELDPSGFSVRQVLSSAQALSLWDTSAFMTNSKNFIDAQIVRAARNGKEEGKRNFILTYDNGIIKQSKLESILFLRPIDVLKWMVQDKFISYQKGVAIFKKWKSKNWVHNFPTFSEIRF